MDGGGFFPTAGASQFAGSEFQPQHADAGPDSGMKKSSTKTETVRNVTIRQIMRDNADTASDKFVVDGHELQLVTLCGRVTKMEEKPGVGFFFNLHDGTGEIEILSYANDVTDDLLNKARADLRLGNYIRLFGVLRSKDNKFSIQSYKLRSITDYNEITYHNLQVIFQRLHLNAGPPPQGMAMAAPAMKQEALAAPMAGGGMQGGIGGAPASLHDQLMELYNSPDVVNSSNGIHVDQVQQMMRMRGLNYSPAQVTEAIAFLFTEGRVYETTDDRTHKSCS